jgi:hypothetical protein
MPPALLKRFYPYKGPKMSKSGKVTAFVAMSGMVVIPQFWLIHDLPLLAFFWLLGLPVLAIFPFFYCKRCRHFSCPMNKSDQGRT